MGLFFGPHRQNFFGVVGLFVGPLGNFVLESWASFLDPWAKKKIGVMGLFFGPLGKQKESWASFLDP